MALRLIEIAAFGEAVHIAPRLRLALTIPRLGAAYDLRARLHTRLAENAAVIGTPARGVREKEQEGGEQGEDEDGKDPHRAVGERTRKPPRRNRRNVEPRNSCWHAYARDKAVRNLRVSGRDEERESKSGYEGGNERLHATTSPFRTTTRAAATASAAADTRCMAADTRSSEQPFWP